MRTNLVENIARNPRDPRTTPRLPGSRDRQLWRTSEHEPQDFGAAGRDRSARPGARRLRRLRQRGRGRRRDRRRAPPTGSPPRRRPRRRSTRRYAYDVGTWNILRQTVQTLMVMPRGGGDPVPEAAQSAASPTRGNERYACTLRKGLKFAERRPASPPQDVKFSIDRARAIKADSGVFAAARPPSTPSRPKGDREVDLPPQDRRRHLPVQAVHARSRASSTPTTTTRTSCATASTSTAPARTRSRPRSRTTSSSRPSSPRTPTTRGVEAEERQGRAALLRRTPTPWAPRSTRATST